MLAITNINNNADSIRVCDHRTQYNKNDLLYAAERVKDAKHANINRRGGRIALAHNIKCAGRIRHKTPRQLKHKLFIEQCIDEYGGGWYWFIECEYYNNIIVVENRDFHGINNGDYSELYENIKKRADDMAGEIIDIIHGVNNYYDTIPAAVADMLYINNITLTQADEINAAAAAFWNNKISFNEYAAELLTALTPHKWEVVTLRGCVQRDIVTALYPADVYTDDDLKEYTAYFFGMYYEYNAGYKNDDYNVTYYFTDRYNTRDIIETIAADYGTTPENVVFNCLV